MAIFVAVFHHSTHEGGLRLHGTEIVVGGDRHMVETELRSHVAIQTFCRSHHRIRWQLGWPSCKEDACGLKKVRAVSMIMMVCS